MIKLRYQKTTSWQQGYSKCCLSLLMLGFIGYLVSLGWCGPKTIRYWCCKVEIIDPWLLGSWFIYSSIILFGNEITVHYENYSNTIFPFFENPLNLDFFLLIIRTLSSMNKIGFGNVSVFSLDKTIPHSVKSAKIIFQLTSTHQLIYFHFIMVHQICWMLYEGWLKW